MSNIKILGTVIETKWNGGAPFRAVRILWGGEPSLARVDPDGTVLVLDNVAKHYTQHHPMSKRQMQRVRTLVAS